MTSKGNRSRSAIQVAFLTVGCRANQADTTRIISSFPPGSESVDLETGECDFVVVNTCAVTARAEADCRKLIRRAKRLNPDARIIVTGCASQVRPEAWSTIPEVDLVVGILDRDKIGEMLGENAFPVNAELPAPGGGVLGPTPLKGHKSRPFLKIQDGCSRGCTYCIVPRARGPERSRPPELIMEDIKLLSSAGFQEIVLTGVHLGRWGWDLELCFEQLLETLSQAPESMRIRLSSVEPMDLTPGLVRRILTHPRICPHLHMPLQSADNRILDLMGRGHTIRDYRTLLEAAVESNPDVAIGTDIMVGFPGEDRSAFENTLKFVLDSPFAYLHVFTYSPRKLTPAAHMSGRPGGNEVKARMKELRSIDTAKRRCFVGAFQGRSLPCLIESPQRPSEPLTALSSNFIRLSIPPSKDRYVPGHTVMLTIDTNNDIPGGLSGFAYSGE
jgi:threonylcarbamoyladenosine tRNA methylthiotransferase MtaB